MLPVRTIQGFARCICIAISFPALSAWAGTMYKTTGPDGRTIYTDVSPTSGKPIRQFESDGQTTPVPEEILRFRAEMMKNADLRVRAERDAQLAGTTIFTAQWCGYCRQAKSYLSRKGIRYRELDIETDTGKRAFAAVSRGGGIPLLIRNGRQTYGFSRASYDALFH